MSDAITTYRLYALPLTTESILTAMNERFSRATPKPEPGYVLIYTAGKQPDGSQQITEDNQTLLSSDDQTWLLESGAVILAEEAAKQQPILMQNLSERVEALEKELERRQREIERKGG